MTYDNSIDQFRYVEIRTSLRGLGEYRNRNYSEATPFKLKLVCNGAAKQVSAGVAPWNMVGFVKLFRTSVGRQVSQKAEPLSTSAAARNGRSGEKTRVSLRETGLVRRCTQFSAKSFNV